MQPSPMNMQNLAFYWYYILRLLENGALYVGIAKLPCIKRNHDSRDLAWSQATTMPRPRHVIVILALLFCADLTVVTTTIVTFTVQKVLSSHDQHPLLSVNIDAYVEAIYFDIAYEVVLYVINVTDCFKVLFMIAVTLMVRSKWLKAVQILVEFSVSAWQQLDRNTVKSEIKNLAKSYKDIGRIVANLQGTFKYWFLLQWIISFTAVIHTSVWMTSLSNLIISYHYWTYYVFYMAHSVFIFMTPYVCGNMMNFYHQRYYQKVRKIQKNIWSNYYEATEGPGDILIFCHKQYKYLIPKKEKYQFIPTIFCLKIPLENPGFIISIFLAFCVYLLREIFLFG